MFEEVMSFVASVLLDEKYSKWLSFNVNIVFNTTPERPPPIEFTDYTANILHVLKRAYMSFCIEFRGLLKTAYWVLCSHILCYLNITEMTSCIRVCYQLYCNVYIDYRQLSLSCVGIQIVLDRKSSTSFCSNAVVPQDSILGPTSLFILINDLLDNNSSQLKIYCIWQKHLRLPCKYTRSVR